MLSYTWRNNESAFQFPLPGLIPILFTLCEQHLEILACELWGRPQRDLQNSVEQPLPNGRGSVSGFSSTKRFRAARVSKRFLRVLQGPLQSVAGFRRLQGRLPANDVKAAPRGLTRVSVK